MLKLMVGIAVFEGIVLLFVVICIIVAYVTARRMG